MKRLGVMQGRLLPKHKGRYQSFPVGRWPEEFSLAASMGLNLIEFIFDLEDHHANPLFSKKGRADILSMSRRTGIGVKTICADYFMDAPLHSPDVEVRRTSLGVLESLLAGASELGVTDIVIPCVDHSSLRMLDGKARFIEALGACLTTAVRYRVGFSLETDLAPEAFRALLDTLNSPWVRVNYDIGNSASLGYPPAEELAAYGREISDIHIKDRRRGGGSVPLGTGDADYPGFFEALAKLDFQGPFIMQAFRDDEGLEVFRRQLDWVRANFAQRGIAL